MMIHKITTSLGYNKLLKCLSTQLNEPSNQNSIKVPKVVSKPVNVPFLPASNQLLSGFEILLFRNTKKGFLSQLTAENRRTKKSIFQWKAKKCGVSMIKL